MMTDQTRERSLLTTALVGALLPPDVPEGHNAPPGLAVPSFNAQ